VTAYLLQQIQLLPIRGHCGLPPWGTTTNSGEYVSCQCAKKAGVFQPVQVRPK
jgi:hypothetical protein